MAKLTKWEIGQELIAISDYITERTQDIENDIEENDDSFNYNLVKKLNKMKAEIGQAFNLLNSHDFGIYDYSNYKKDYGG